jgi:hypothetical protein
MDAACPSGKVQLPDVRYRTIKPMFKSGDIKVFTDLFLYIKKTVVAKDIGKSSRRFTFLLSRPEKFTIEEAMMIGKLCDLSFEEMMGLIKAQVESRKVWRET